MYTIKPKQTIIDFADHQAPVSKNVLNDGFRFKRALSVIEKERLDIDFSCFKSLQKEKEEIGFVTYSPNFNMSNSSITVIYTANMKTLKKLNLTDGQLSKFIKSLDMGKLVRYDHQPKLQAALDSSTPADNEKNNWFNLRTMIMDIASIFKLQKDFLTLTRQKDIDFRKDMLAKLKHILKTNEDQLYDAIYKDFRKGKFETFLTELNLVYNEIDYFLKNLKKLSKPKKVKTALNLQPGKSYIHYDPLGVTLVIGAWNYPYQLTLSPVVSAIAAGNTCMIKPSELPENTMHLLADLINTNFPSNYLHVVRGGVPETGELLKLRFDKIFFTGSPKVGKIVYEAAAKNLVPVTLELGGKSPAIVTETADLDVAVKRLVWGKFLNGGQTCIAPDYLLVAESVKPKFLQLITEKLQEIDYSDGAEHYTSIINKRNFDRILGLVDQSKVIYGGNFNAESLYIEPVIMDHVGWEDPVMQEEIFGPVLPVITYSNYDDVLNKIIEGEKPLAAYLFSNNEEEKDKLLKLVSFGGGCINDTLMHITNDYLPFGGVGNSGIGNYHGEFGFLTFSHQKSVIEKTTWGEPDWKYPPYTDKKMHWLKKVL